MDETTMERSQDGETQGRQALKVTGTLTIARASQFRDALLEALDAADELRVDLSEVTGLDLTGLQLLCAAHQSAATVGKRLEVLDGGNATFRKAIADACFQRHVGCACDASNSCIWVIGEN